MEALAHIVLRQYRLKKHLFIVLIKKQFIMNHDDASNSLDVNAIIQGAFIGAPITDNRSAGLLPQFFY